MEEAVTQVSHSSITAPPPAVQRLGDFVQPAESLVEQASKVSDTIKDICDKLKFLQDLGDKLSEVGYYIVV